MQNIKSLQKLGLSETEAAVFLFLTQHGPSSGPQIQAALDIPKVPAYRALNSLDARDLVMTTGDKRRQRYIAQPSDMLLKQYDNDIAELRQAKAEMQTFVESQGSQDSQLYKERKVQVYEGIEGYRLWINERLRDEGIIIRQIADSRFWQDFSASPAVGEANTARDAAKRAAKGIELRSIFTRKADLPQHARTDLDNLKLTRYLAMPSTPTINLSMFGSRVGYFSGDGETYRGVIIEDKMLASLLIIIFDILWEQSETV